MDADRLGRSRRLGPQLRLRSCSVVRCSAWSSAASGRCRPRPSCAGPRRCGPARLCTAQRRQCAATTIAAPLGSYLGQYIGWRGAFFCVVPLAAVTFAWLFAEPSKHAPNAASVRAVLRPSRSFAVRRCRSACSPSRCSSWDSSLCSLTCGRSSRRSSRST